MISTQTDRASDTSPAPSTRGPSRHRTGSKALAYCLDWPCSGCSRSTTFSSFAFPFSSNFCRPLTGASAIDRALEGVLAGAIEPKALALFSFLFGVGLAIQFDRLAGNPSRVALLIRRLVVLLVTVRRICSYSGMAISSSNTPWLALLSCSSYSAQDGPPSLPRRHFYSFFSRCRYCHRSLAC
jgi:hypothetical protein